MPPPLDTKTVLGTSLQQVNTPAAKAVLDNPSAFAFLLAMFNGTLGMVSGKPADVVMGLASKGLATADITAKVSGAKGVALTSSAIQILLTTASLASLAGKVHPAAAIATVGAALATKTSLALGMAGDDDKRAACIAAVADIAAAGGTMAAGILTTSTGVGAVSGIGPLMIASSLASLILSGYKAHQACLR